MAKKKKEKGGIVFSTNPDFNSNQEDNQIEETLPPEKQNLKVWLDKKQRKGKIVTLITGFEGNAEDLKELEKKLKNICGSGGSSKNGEILIQGDSREKIIDYLLKAGYKAKKAGS